MSGAPLTNRTILDGSRATEHVDFSLTDKRGRAIGATVETATFTFTALPPDATSGWCHAPGTFFGLNIQATRNGRDYGASQPWRFFASETERASAQAASLAASRRRAAAKLTA